MTEEHIQSENLLSDALNLKVKSEVTAYVCIYCLFILI